MACRDGDLSARLPADWPGIDGGIAETFNQTIVRLDIGMPGMSRFEVARRMRGDGSLKGAVLSRSRGT